MEQTSSSWFGKTVGISVWSLINKCICWMEPSHAFGTAITSAGIHLDEPFPHARLSSQEGFTLPWVNLPSLIETCDSGRAKPMWSFGAAASWPFLLFAALMVSTTFSSSSETGYSLHYHGKVVFIISHIDVFPNMILGNRVGKAGSRWGDWGRCAQTYTCV